MPSIDRWTTKAVIDALRMKHPALVGMDIVCINISGQSLNDDRFLEYIVNLLEEDIDNSRICFDISESSLISSVDRAQFFIATLKELGCKIALDDLGFGMSSFELLKRLQVDYLKINRDIVRNMAYSSVDYEIVLALSRIAKTLHVQTIAQGVATLATKDSLLGMGVDFVQGILIDQPQLISFGERYYPH
ncbi:MAG: EAL domain-containing protein [Proteobacteria bacterium]|nr:EAL domain-containing protein [Pseudomonadota bacterium]